MSRPEDFLERRPYRKTEFVKKTKTELLWLHRESEQGEGSLGGFSYRAFLLPPILCSVSTLNSALPPWRDLIIQQLLLTQLDQSSCRGMRKNKKEGRRDVDSRHWCLMSWQPPMEGWKFCPGKGAGSGCALLTQPGLWFCSDSRLESHLTFPPSLGSWRISRPHRGGSCTGGSS
jgi:hypothetical protein